MPQPSWCRNLTKRATVSIDVLFINTISDAVHSCTCHDVPGRALNRLVINRTSASATDKMCGGRFIPFTGRIVHFIASKPQTGLARGQCQSGLWQRVSGSTVLTGKIANGERLPLPSGFSASQCTWSVSNAENPHGWKPNYFAGSVATYDSNRIVKCGYYDEYNFHGGTNRNDLTGKCSYIVVCQ